MSHWREAYLDDFDSLEKIIRMLAPADPIAQDAWRTDRTYTEIAQAFCELTMFKH